MIQAPSLTGMIAIVLLVTMTGAALDKLVLSSRLEAWRRKIGELWIKLNTPGARALAQDANQLYCDLFDYIYGRRTFAWRRVWTSIVSSITGMVVFTLIVGLENSFWRRAVEFISEKDATGAVLVAWVFLVFFIPIVSNLIPDFFSLFETRLVLKWSRGRGPLGIVFLVILDLILTTTIFAAGCTAWVIVAVSIGLLMGKTDSSEAVKLVWDFLTSWLPVALFMPRIFLIFFLTTFVTSFFWILFVLTFGIIWVFHRLSPLAKFVYYAIGQSDRPAATLSAYLNSVVIGVYVLWRVVEWTLVI